MFNFIKSKLQRIYDSLTTRLQTIFNSNTIDENTLKELELLLIQSDTGLKTTREIINALKTHYARGSIQKGTDLKKELALNLNNLLIPADEFIYCASVYLLVGINGSGKTTCAAKLAHRFSTEGKRVLLVAADTFRAAAVQQLEQWSRQLGVPLEKGIDNQDPASVVFNGCARFTKEHFDVVIIDTAGRLQTKSNLMKELEKIKRIITKQLPDKKIVTLLTIDSMLGQNSLDQARLFHESTDVSGILLTKMDGTGKGGIIFAIGNELKLPVAYISYGEKLDQLKTFEPKQFVTQLLEQ